MIEVLMFILGVVVGAACAYAYCRSDGDDGDSFGTKSGGGPGEEK